MLGGVDDGDLDGVAPFYLNDVLADDFLRNRTVCGIGNVVGEGGCVQGVVACDLDCISDL